MYLAAITGGLDLKLAIWDFSKGRPHNVIDYGKRKELTFGIMSPWVMSNKLLLSLELL